MIFSGSYPALITPMDNNGQVDEKGFSEFVAWQINQGSNGLVPAGTTGESSTLSHKEHQRVIDLCVEIANNKVPVIAGAGSNATEEALSLTRYAKKAGAQAALVVTPYYNKPTQEGLYQHYATIARACDFPIVIYNIPGRSVVNMSVETMTRLAKDFPSIFVGVKDSDGTNLSRVVATRCAIGPDFCQLSGEDATALGFLALGGHGCISVTANVAPKLCARMQKNALEGKHEEAAIIRDQLHLLHEAMFYESNPAPAKYALSLIRDIQPKARLPIVPLSESGQKHVKTVMKTCGLL